MTPVVLFLDAADRVLVRRFESVRRPHPMQPPGTILDAIAAERALLQPVREHLAHQQAQRQQRVQSTKVEFFTVARESGGMNNEEESA